MASMQEWFAENFPIQNTTSVKDIAVLRVGPTSTGVDLRTLFGNNTQIPKPSGSVPLNLAAASGLPNIDAGHYYSIQADGAGASPTGAATWRAYVALSNGVKTVDPNAVSTASGACWALKDTDPPARWFIPPGREVSTGVATLTAFTTLNFVCPAGGGTGWLRIYRSSVSGDQDTADAFPDPFVRF